jgi:hypothetical protein
MNLLWRDRFDVKEGQHEALVAWLSENEAKFAEHAPEGSEYLGIYFTVFTSEKDSGTCEIVAVRELLRHRPLPGGRERRQRDRAADGRGVLHLRGRREPRELEQVAHTARR